MVVNRPASPHAPGPAAVRVYGVPADRRALEAVPANDAQEWLRIERLLARINQVESELDQDVLAGRGIWRSLAAQAGPAQR